MAGKIQLIQSADYHQLLQELQSGWGPPSEMEYDWLAILPAPMQVRIFTEAYSGAYSQSGSISPPFFTLEGLLEHLFEYHPSPKKWLSARAQRGLVYLALKQVQKELQVFHIREEPITPQVVATFQKILQRLTFQEEKPAEALAHSSDDNLLVQDLNRIYRAYASQKAEKYLDERDFLQYLMADDQGQLFKQAFPKLQRVDWWIEQSLFPLHFQFLEWLREQGYHLQLFIHNDHTNPDIFGNLHNTVAHICRLADEVQARESTRDWSQRLYVLEAERREAPESLSIWKAPSRLSEVETVVKAVKKALLDAHPEPLRIGITAPNLSTYESMLGNLLANYQVGYSFHHSPALIDTLPIQHLRLLLEILTQQEPLGKIIRILKSPFFQYHKQLEGLPVEAELFQLRVSTGLKRMISQLEGRMKYFREGYAEEEGEVNPEQEIEGMNRLLTVLKKLQQDLKPFQQNGTAFSFYQKIVKCIEAHHWNREILGWQETVPPGEVGAILGAVRQFLEALQQFGQLAHQQDAQQPFSTEGYLEIFDLAASYTHLTKPSPMQWPVHIFPLEWAGFFPVDQLYVLGMEESAFPRSNVRLLPAVEDAFAEILQESQMQQDRQLFLKLLQRPFQRLVFSYPEFEDANPLIMSSVLWELQRISGLQAHEPEPLPVLTPRQYLAEMANKSNSAVEKLCQQWEFLKPLKEEFTILLPHRREVVAQREKEAPPGAFEGELGNDSLAAEFLTRKYTPYQFSASALELYARCPMQFFLQRVLGVTEPEEFEEWMTPLERGTLVHRVLYRFYSELNKSNRSKEALLKIAEEEFQKLPLPHSILREIQKEAFLGGAERPGLFPRFWEVESAWLEGSSFVPVFFELPFGSVFTPTSVPFHAQAARLEVEGVTFYLRGKIDRLEKDTQNNFFIVDYKTGNIPGKKDLLDGLSLQLPLYLLAARQVLPQLGESGIPVGAAYYSVKSDSDDGVRRSNFLIDKSRAEGALRAMLEFPTADLWDNGDIMQFEDFLNRMLTFAGTYVKNIRQGHFPHTSDLQRCETYRKTCPFMPACRRNTFKIRALAKNQSSQANGGEDEDREL